MHSEFSERLGRGFSFLKRSQNSIKMASFLANSINTDLLYVHVLIPALHLPLFVTIIYDHQKETHLAKPQLVPFASHGRESQFYQEGRKG